GMFLLTLAVTIPSLKPPSCGKNISYLDYDKQLSSLQVGIFYYALYIIALEVDNVGWGLGYGIPTVALLVAMVVFIDGTPTYRHKPSSGSPFTKMAKVLVATTRNWNRVVPEDPKKLYELSMDDYSGPAKYMIGHSTTLRKLKEFEGKKLVSATKEGLKLEET
ncbi:NRT1/ PTR family 5.2-like protein, partial [Tanacetum coccineum]